ncbi:MAG: lytic transglycosylase [Actinomycetota bacterium]|nr:lytic transglycosylase [Actinomycetota bacterium]
MPSSEGFARPSPDHHAQLALVAAMLVSVLCGAVLAATNPALAHRSTAVAAPASSSYRIGLARLLAGSTAIDEAPAALVGPANLTTPVADPASPAMAISVDPASVLPTPVPAALLGDGIPAVVLAAYERAAAQMALRDPGCRLRWQVLAGIGRVESNHGRDGATGITPDGTITPPILGPVLDGGPGMAAIPDTDGGALDGDRTWDRAVGPMQFIPSTWRSVAGDRNPNNIGDAAEAAGRYLCDAAHGDVSTPRPLANAIFAYNPSASYVATVLGWIAAYDLAGPTGQPGRSLPLVPPAAALIPPAPPPPPRPVPAPVLAARAPGPSVVAAPKPPVTPTRTTASGGKPPATSPTAGPGVAPPVAMSAGCPTPSPVVTPTVTPTPSAGTDPPPVGPDPPAPGPVISPTAGTPTTGGSPPPPTC